MALLILLDIHIEFFHTCSVIKLHKHKCNTNLDVIKSIWLNNTLIIIFQQTNHKWNYGSKDRPEGSDTLKAIKEGQMVVSYQNCW